MTDPAERDRLLAANAELVTALADLLKLLDTTTGLPSYAKARAVLLAHGPTDQATHTAEPIRRMHNDF